MSSGLLPEHFTDTYGASHPGRLSEMYGVQVTLLDRDDLLAVIAWLATDGKKIPLYSRDAKDATDE